MFAIARQNRTLAILELGRARQHNFVDRLLALRDEERARLPAIARQQLEHDDQALQSRSIDELWTLPPQLGPGIASRDDTYSRPKPDLANGPRTTAGKFLRATLQGDQEEIQRLAHELNQGHQGWNDDEPAVIEAACQLAARRFFSEYLHVPVEDFVTADMGDRLSPRMTAPSQHDMEAVIRAALDDGASLPTNIKRADLMRIRGAVTANISGILKLDATEINSLAAQSEHMATACGYDPPLAKT